MSRSASDFTTPDVTTAVVWMRLGTRFLFARLDDIDLAAPSALPRWTNGHVVSHVARNADALLRLLHWARTGEQTPMYASAELRNAEIERDAAREPDVQRADLRATAAAFDAAVAETDDDTWTARVRSTRREIAAGELPWMRVKEVWLHAVDLGAPVARIRSDVAVALVADVVGSFADRDDVPAMHLTDTDSRRSFAIGAGGPSVTGTAADLAGWLTGRTDGRALQHPDGLPTLPAWL